jgi:hypothetical protein
MEPGRKGGAKHSLTANGYVLANVARMELSLEYQLERDQSLRVDWDLVAGLPSGLTQLGAIERSARHNSHHCKWIDSDWLWPIPQI